MAVARLSGLLLVTSVRLSGGSPLGKLAATTVNDDPIIRCRLGRLWDDLDDDDRATLTDWIKREFGTPRIQRGFMEGGLGSVSSSAIDKHLKGSCCCGGSDPIKGVRGAAAQR